MINNFDLEEEDREDPIEEIGERSKERSALTFTTLILLATKIVKLSREVAFPTRLQNPP